MCTKIEDLGAMYYTLSDEQKEKIMFCIDTCHIFSAGYAINTTEGAQQFIDLFEEHIGWHKVICIHFNDSKTECGSQVDRHEHLGHGKIGPRGLRAFLSDLRCRGIPRIGELPPGEKEDRGNLAFLRSCSGAS
ncbi:MAG: hypothetical protein EBU36_02355 [Verrucomicrobia bacterium]|nr:hypothetical protein [Verrucomicrobiota bacterium]